MTDTQRTLIKSLASKRIVATFERDSLACCVTITKVNGKKKRNQFSFAFDDAAHCQGARLLPSSVRGTYADSLAKQAAEIIFEFSAKVAQEIV